MNGGLLTARRSSSSYTTCAKQEVFIVAAQGSITCGCLHVGVSYPVLAAVPYE